MLFVDYVQEAIMGQRIFTDEHFAIWLGQIRSRREDPFYGVDMALELQGICLLQSCTAEAEFWLSACEHLKANRNAGNTT